MQRDRVKRRNPRDLEVVIHQPASLMKHPGKLFRSMIVDLLASRGLAWQLLLRDLNAKYRQSLLGYVWAIIPPVIMAAGFTLAKDNGAINVGQTDLPYPAYVMLSMSLWQTFVEALNGPIQAVAAAKQMITRVNFPREALILAKLGEVGFNFAIKLVLIVGLFVWFKIPLTWSIVIAPVALIHLIAFGTFIGLFLAPIALLFQDITMALTLVTALWLFITPVLFPIPTSGIMATIVRLNPVTPLLMTTRELATVGIVSDPQGFWVASAIALVGLLLAWIVYRLAMPFVVERISA